MSSNDIKKNTNEPYSGYLWESGQFSVGRNVPPLPKKEKIYSAIEHDESYYGMCSLHTVERDFLESADVATEEKIALIEDLYYYGRYNSYQRYILLGLVSAPISHKPPISARLRKGLSGITSLGRYTLENSVVRLAEEVGLDRLTFGTVTFPPLSYKLRNQLIASDYRLLEKEFRRRIVRHLEQKSDIPHELIMSIEIQEKRFKSTGYPYLHWHFIFVAKAFKGVVNDDNPYWLTEVELPHIWGECVKDWLHGRMILLGIGYSDDEIDGLNFIRSCSLVKCQNLSAQYLGKYLSKGCFSVKTCIDKGFELMIPFHWWYVSPSLKKRVQAFKIKLAPQIAQELFLNVEQLENYGYIKSFTIIETEWNDSLYPVGVSGRMTKEGQDWVKKVPLGENYILPLII